MAKLTDEQISGLATSYGFEVSDRTVIENVEQANNLDGKKSNVPFWGTDEDGIYSAYKLLDGYLHEESRVARCDDLALAKFHSDAFGED